MNDDTNKPNINTGNITNSGNMNIGGTQTFHGNVTINHGVLSAAPAGSPQEELKALLQELEAALKQAPAEQAEDVKVVQKIANDIATEAAQEAPGSPPRKGGIILGRELEVGLRYL